MIKSRIRYWKHFVRRRIFSEEINHLPSNKIYVSFTFDTEEDWENNNPLYDSSMVYYDSYKYINSGALYRLADGLNKRNASATFYITYNIARDMLDVPKYLEEFGHAIGAHLHPHNFDYGNIKYPYDSGNGDKITANSFSEKKKWMTLLKNQIESVLGHDIALYRSGRLECDNDIEAIANSIGFEAISNHLQVSYNRSCNIWNLGVGKCDIFDFREFDILDKYIELFKSSWSEKIIVFSAHPMLLYNHATNEIREKDLDIFLEFVDYLKNLENVEMVNQYKLLQIVKDSRITNKKKEKS